MKREYEAITETQAVERRSKMMNCFCFGFMLSAIFTLLAFGLTQYLWYQNELRLLGIEKPCEKRIVGTYRLSDYRGVSEGQLSKLTHLIFVSLHYLSNGNVGFISSEDKRKFREYNDKAKQFKVKTLLTVEVGDYKAKNMSGLMEDPDKRRQLVNSIVYHVREFRPDGINFFWVTENTKVFQWFFTTLCRELREELTKLAQRTKRRYTYVISISSPPKNAVFDFEEILKYVDFINLETENYYSSWVKNNKNHLTGPPSPLYSGHGKDSEENLDATLKYYSCLTGKPNQLNIGVTFSGRFWKKILPPDDPSETLWMTARSDNGTVDGGAIAWRELKEDKEWNITLASWNHESKTPYIYDSEKRVYRAFENERSLKEKIKYAIDKNIGGFTIWSISADDDEDTMLSVLGEGELCSGENNRNVNYDC